jgi:mono/diheme cytochrome c family protein
MKVYSKTVAVLAAAIAVSIGVSACGTQGIQVPKSSAYYHGAVLFLDHCSGCHTLATVGAEGSATSIKDRLRTNGPNFNYRKENVAQVLYALHNGGFSGAIMPENILVGNAAREVAKFLTKYSGLEAPKVPTIEDTSVAGTSTGTTTAESSSAATAAAGATTGGGSSTAAGGESGTSSSSTGAATAAERSAGAAGGVSAKASPKSRGKAAVKAATK